MTAENPYTLYVQSGRNPGISLAEGIEDAGIINSSMNQFKPVYIVDNLMTLTGLKRTTAAKELREWVEAGDRGIAASGGGRYKVYVRAEKAAK